MDVFATLRRLDEVLSALGVSFVCIFIGHFLFRYIDYINHPEYYAMMSAPWYTSVQLIGILSFIVLLFVIISKWFIKRTLNK